MKKLSKIRNVGLCGVGIAIVLELIGELSKITAVTVAAFVILICCIIAYLVFFRCSHCGAFLGGRYGSAIRVVNGEHICPHCSRSLEE